MKKAAPTLNLAAFHDSINDTLELASQLRNAGIPAQAKHLEDLPHLFECLRSEPIDIVLHLQEITDPSLDQVVKAVHTHRVDLPVLAMTHAYSVEALNQAIAQGACDLINLDNPAHVLHVFKRERERIFASRRLGFLESMQQESERRCKTLMQSSRDAIAYIHGGMHIDANDVYLQTLGFQSLDDMEGVPLLDLVEAEDHAEVREVLRGGNAKSDEPLVLEGIHFKHQQGDPIVARVEFSPATIDGEACTQVLIRLTSDADTKALEEKIAQLSQRDPQTGLLNRQFYLEQLGNKLSSAHGGRATFALIHVQVSYPLAIRNKIGVLGRDAIIREAGRLLEKHADSNALISLYSSNVFAVLAPCPDQAHQAAQAHAQSLAQSLIEALSRHVFEAGGQSVTVEATAGIVLLDEHSPKLDELLRRAERVSAEAGENPGGTVLVFKPKQKDASQVERDEHWNRLLRDALRTHQFRLLFQPILSMNGDLRRQRYELFLRLLDDERQMVEPAAFIESAERSGISIDIDRYVIQGAIGQVVDARKRGLNLQLFVRISTPTLLSADFFPWFSAQIMNAQIYDGAIVLQINESIALEQLKQVQQLVESLQRIHCSLLIDGVGLNEVVDQLFTRVAVPWAKLDRGLLSSLSVQKANQARVFDIIKTLKQHEGLEVILPQIENAATLQIAYTSGADFLQGNFIQGLSDRLDFDFSSF